MADCLKSAGRRLCNGWIVWPLALLALPACFLDATGYGVPDVFEAGPEPRTGAIMCDIPKVPPPGSSDCATPTEIDLGISLAQAAVALVEGESSSLALDFSPEALNACGGDPRKIEFFGPFPDGYTICLNCGTQIPSPYANAKAACVAKCTDLVGASEVSAPGGAAKFCEDNVKVSTNFDAACYADACTSGGTPKPEFDDPRWAQEPVKWVDLLGTQAVENTLTKTDTTVAFDSGAASEQLITSGNAWVEFEVGENDQGHILGVSPAAGPDTDPSGANIAFGIRLKSNGGVTIHEGGTEVGDPHGTYAVGERFRVRIADNNDGTATISYTRLNGPCMPRTVCSETVFATQMAPSPSYPLRVDASLGAEGARLVNVTLVRIK